MLDKLSEEGSGMATGRDGEPRGCLPTLVIAVLMLAIVGAGVVAADSLRDRPPVPVAVGAGVSVAPPAGWEFVDRVEAPTGDQDGIVLTRGSGSLYVYPSPQDATRALGELRGELVGSPLLTVGEIEPAELGGARDGLRIAFSGVLPELSATPLEGEGIAVAGSEVAVIFFAWSEVGGYALLRDELVRMIDGATIP